MKPERADNKEPEQGRAYGNIFEQMSEVDTVYVANTVIYFSTPTEYLNSEYFMNHNGIEIVIKPNG